MLNYKFYFIVLIAIISCKNSTSSKHLSSNDSNASNASLEKRELMNSEDTIGFFSNCQELISHSSLGSLQGVEAGKDSLKNLYFAACYDCKKTFEIVFVHKVAEKRKDQNYNSLSNEFRSGCIDYFKNFNCFAFISPMRDPDKQEDVHAMNIDFPVEVQVYERTSDDVWKFIKKVKAKSFNEYALLQFKSIYHLE